MRKLKGKVRKKGKKIMTLIYMPNSSTKNAKTFRISYYYQKMIALYLLIALIFTSTGIYILHLKNINQELETTQSYLESVVSEQNNLLFEKKDLLALYQEQQTISEEVVNKFNNKASNIVDSYINDKIDSIKVSRSGDEDTPSFTQDIQELESIMEYIDSSKKSEIEIAENLADAEKDLSDFLDTLPTMWPLDEKVHSPFGMRMHPIYKRNILHTGIDIGGTMNAPIKASGSGKVIYADVNGGYGNCIIIQHSELFKSYYAHCSKLLVKEGDLVSKGQVIANVGSTGVSTGPHLHFEIRISDTPVNPLKFLEKRN